MGMKKWKISSFDKALAKELAMECDVDPIVALIASARGYSDPMELEQFVSDEPVFSDPQETADIIKAADIINAVIEDGGKIAVYGDYDCDGVTATALMYSYLKTRNSDCVYYIPDRFTEGYGMNVDAVEKLAADGVKLIITVDNGIKCFEEISLANKLGMTVVVTDHHLPDETLPEAAAVVDPHRKDCPSTFKEICGAQVAFRLICVMENREPEELLPYFADMLALAVLGDIMPLTLENRTIVKYGINKLKNSPITGLSALLNVAGISQDTVNSGRISFGLVPRINAAGRMGKAERAVELLITDNIMTALNIANEIDNENALRQQTEKIIFEQAVEIIERDNLKYDRVIVVGGEKWHHGVVGIVASRICEKYGAPAILLSIDGDVATGSGRSIKGFSLYNAIENSKDLLVKFGGHSQAAGITIETNKIKKFREDINSYARNIEFVAPEICLDCKLNPSALSLDLAFALKQLEPFGEGNSVPLFGLYDVTLERITPIGNNKHLRLLFSKDTNTFQALLFGVTAENFCFEIGDKLDLAVTVDTNLYKGEYSVSVQIKGIRISGTDDDELFSQIAAVNDFFANAPCDYDGLLPTRQEVGEVYKFVSSRPVLAEKVKYSFIKSLGYAKTVIAIQSLTELGLISKNEKDMFFAVKDATKTALNNAPTYKKLLERSGNCE